MKASVPVKLTLLSHVEEFLSSQVNTKEISNPITVNVISSLFLADALFVGLCSLGSKLTIMEGVLVEGVLRDTDVTEDEKCQAFSTKILIVFDSLLFPPESFSMSNLTTISSPSS